MEAKIPTSEARSLTALHIRELDLTVTAEELSRLFKEKGNVISVKICMAHNSTDGTIAVFGYVNYTNPQDAAKALEELNFTLLKGKCISLSYSDLHTSLRGSIAANVFVKNLDKKIDHKALFGKFSSFGTIISATVETNSSGQPKGYGYVQYTSKEAAQKAIEQLNGMVLHGKELYVAPFKSKEEREHAIDKSKYTNVFVKNLSDQTTEEYLKTRFGEFGLTSSVALMRHEDGTSKCFGFVNFVNHEDAVKSVEALNGKVFDNKQWYVARAQTKYEREQEFGERNLYIKYLGYNINDDMLKDLFSPFGTITSSKVLYDPKGRRTGAGFVAFSTTQEASRALSAMNGKSVGRRPLYVALAEKKEDRKARLQALSDSILAHIPSPPSPPALPVLGQPMFSGRGLPPIRPPMGFGHHSQEFVYPQTFVPGIRLPGPPIRNTFYPPVPYGKQRARPNGVFQQTPRPGPVMYQPMPFRGNGHHFTPGYRPQHVSAPVTNEGTRSIPGENGGVPVQNGKAPQSMSVECLASSLANDSPAVQKKRLDEALYPLVEEIEHEKARARKVTEKLLEMDHVEVLILLESPESLRAMVAKAVEEIMEFTPDEQLASLSLAD